MTARHIALFLCLLAVVPGLGCGWLGYGADPGPAPVELPDNPIERAAVAGLKTSYRDSAMWQIQRVATLNVTPVAPSAAVLRDQDPKELYCVCLEYEARYKVAWSTGEGSPWERTVRSILVMKTQGDDYMALRPLNVCPALCE